MKRAEAAKPSTKAVLCNALAWIYATAPEAFRDKQEAVALAERAVALWDGEWDYHNTLGVAYYRAGRYHDAVAALERSLANGAGQADARDLYFLAMCHHQLGARDRALDCFERAKTWHDSRAAGLSKPDDSSRAASISKEEDEELRLFRKEAEEMLRRPAAFSPAPTSRTLERSRPLRFENIATGCELRTIHCRVKWSTDLCTHIRSVRRSSAETSTLPRLNPAEWKMGEGGVASRDYQLR